MHSEAFSYGKDGDNFSISHRRALSHNMPYNHFHGTYEVFYLVSGERCFFIKDRTIIIRAGDLVLIKPNILHKTTNASLPEHERIITNFHEDFIITPKNSFFQMLQPIFENEYIIISLPLNQRSYIEEVLNRIIQEVQQKSTGFEVYVQTLLLQLLIFSCRYMERNAVKPLVHPTPVHERISQIVRFINEYYAQDLSLHCLSEQFYISPYYLSRAFKEATGFTFVEYLNSVRVKEAKKLLEESGLKVNKIADKVGFGSITHFGRVFREITGHAPLYYRKNSKSRKGI